MTFAYFTTMIATSAALAMPAAPQSSKPATTQPAKPATAGQAGDNAAGQAGDGAARQAAGRARRGHHDDCRRCRRREGETEEPRRAQGRRAGRVPRVVRHQRRPVRDPGAPELGAEGGRPVLQPREVRLLRQRPVLPRDAQLHGAVRHQRRPDDPGALAGRDHHRRAREAEQQAGNDYLRQDRAPPTRGRRRCSSISATTGRSTARVSRRSAKWCRAWKRWTRSTRSTASSRMQPMIQRQGNAYLMQSFPKLDYVRKATIVKTPAPVKPVAKAPVKK